MEMVPYEIKLSNFNIFEEYKIYDIITNLYGEYFKHTLEK